jgi:hypothetical protein
MKLDRIRGGPALCMPAAEVRDPCHDGALARPRRVPGSFHLKTPTSRCPGGAQGRGRRHDHVRSAVSDDQPEVGTGSVAHDRHCGRHAEDVPLEREAGCPQTAGSGASNQTGNRRIARRKQPWSVGERPDRPAFAATVDGCGSSSTCWLPRGRHARNRGRAYHHEGQDDDAPPQANHDSHRAAFNARSGGRGLPAPEDRRGARRSNGIDPMAAFRCFDNTLPAPLPVKMRADRHPGARRRCGSVTDASRAGRAG